MPYFLTAPCSDVAARSTPRAARTLGITALRSKRIDASRAVSLVPSGSRIMVGGFGLVGAPLQVLKALAMSQARNLTVIANNLGEPGLGLGGLLRNGQVKHVIGTYFTSNPEAVAAISAGAVTYDLIPQGNMVEAIRAGGAGIAGFYTPTGPHTALADEREVRRINGAEYLFQPALRADIALIKAEVADELGNLTYRLTARNFNPVMATAADIVIAEVEQIVPPGQLDPEMVVTPHVYIDFIVQAHTSVEDLGTSSVTDAMRSPTESELRMAQRVRKELHSGQVVNLGIGQPALVVRYIGPDDGIYIQTENGLLGAGPPPPQGSALEFPVDAAKHPLTALPGSSYFDSAQSFAMIRGGHIDVAVLGALQVDGGGSLANWSVPPKTFGVGGAMDLAAGAQKLIVMMSHLGPDGQPKLVRQCTLPVTASHCVDTVVTDLGVFRLRQGQLILVELMPDINLDQVRDSTEASFEVRLESP